MKILRWRQTNGKDNLMPACSGQSGKVRFESLAAASFAFCTGHNSRNVTVALAVAVAVAVARAVMLANFCAALLAEEAKELVDSGIVGRVKDGAPFAAVFYQAGLLQL